MKKFFLQGAAVTALACMMAPAAMAQDAPVNVETVVVSAEKRETPLQQTPIAIAVASPQFLEDRHVQSLLDIASSIPSLRVATFEARQSALTVGIRGIVPFDANQTARDQGVGVYLDGVYLGRQQGLNAALLDIQRIEVLRGPQGTLFGRNTEGGAVSIVTRAPTGEFDARILTGVGNYGQYSGEIHMDFPAFYNIAIKADGIINHQDATTTNPLSGQYGWNYYNRYGGRISALWTPIDNFKATFAYDTGVDQNTPFYSQLVNYNPLGRTVGVYDLTTNRLVAPGSAVGAPTCSSCIAPLSSLVQVNAERQDAAEIGVPQQLSVNRTDGFTANMAYDFGPELTLRSITAWRGTFADQWDNSGGAHRTIYAPNANFSRYSLSMLRQHQFSEEFQAVGTIGQVDYVAGLYYFHENATEKASTPATNRWNATGTGYTINSQNAIGTITSSNQGWDPASWFTQRNSFASADSYSVFGQATWTPDFMPELHLTGGLRYTDDERQGTLIQVQNKSTNFPFTFSGDRVDPLARVAYDAADNIHLYATYSTGYRAGGANARSQTFTAFGPEEVESYEIGAKTDLFENRIRLNVAAYMMERTGIQTDFDNVDTNPNSPTFNLHTEETRNAPGLGTNKGVEVELTTWLTENLTAGLSYAYTFTKVPATPNPFLNNVLYPVYVVFTPENAGSVYFDYSQPITEDGMLARFHMDFNYADGNYSFQNEPVKTEANLIINARLGLADIPMGSGPKLNLALWVRNLTDVSYIYRRSAANAAVLGDYANFNPPRTFGVEATTRF